MIYGSVCSGIEAATVAWHPLGWEPAFFAEIDPFARAVLSHHFPEVPLHADFTTIQAGQYRPIDILVGGTPCQSFSVAGFRGGLADARGNLALEYILLAQRLRPRWVVWENVPGVLSSDGGRDFGAFIGGLAELGYGIGYRVLDAQYFNLAQRRERVFVVGSLGDWRAAVEVLFEPASLRGDTPPRREAGQRVARPIASCPPGGSGYRNDPDTADNLTVADPISASEGKTWTHEGKNNFRTHNLVQAYALGPHATTDSAPGSANGSDVSEELAFTVQADRVQSVAFGGNNQAGPIDVATAVNAHGGPHGRIDFESETFVCFDPNQITSKDNRSNPRPGDPSPPLATFGSVPMLAHTSGLETETDMLVTHTLNAHRAGSVQEDGTGHGIPLTVTHSLRADGFDASEDGTGRGTPLVASFQQSSMTGVGTVGYDPDTKVLRPVKPQHDHQMLQLGSAVRRLTPRECARLQGFPDDYLDIEYRGRPAADGNKYKALGNSMAVPVMRWIGERIDDVEGGNS